MNNFIDEAAKTNATINETENKIRISIVVYEDNAQTENDLTICEGNNVDSLKRTVNSLNGDGATNAGAGMTNANRVLRDSNRQNADQVVIFFTDGVPTTYRAFDSGVANTAVEQARQIKNRGASVYSIGVFDGADPSVTNASNNSGDTRKANTFMNAVSSNYPNSQSWNNLGNRINETAAYYKTASDSTKLNQIFNDIFDESTENIGSGSPIEESSGAEGTPGNLKFTDQLGKYMEVTGDTMYLVFADGVHEGKSSDGGFTWQFTGNFQANDVYPAADLSNIKVSVEKSGNGDVVTVTIPASLLPMRHYSVDSDKGTLNVSNTYPIRLFYGVSLKQEAEDAIIKASGETYSNIVNSQKSDDGKINFYSNNYSENQAAGLTTATFTPSDGNKFYYYTENTQLYTDPDCTIQANRYNAGDTLYYKNPYWTTDSNVEVTNDPGVVQRGGSEWSAIQYDGSGNAYIPSGTHRTDRPQTLVKVKTKNETNTAKNVITPAWGAGEIVNISLGNNGRISYPALGALEIKKSVNWGNASENTKKSKNSFTFTVDLKDKEGVSLPGEYSYYVGGEEEAKGVVKDGGTVTIDGGQSVVIRGLPDGTQFEVLENGANTNGFTTTDDYSKPEENADTSDGKVNGTIVGGSQESVTFTNVYDANDVNLSSEAVLKVQKNLSGRDWRDTDEFVFEIDALGNTATSTIETPKPTDTTIKIDESTNNYIAQFGDITFTAPGEYSYAITEDSDTNPINGIDYSAARYRVVINVIDNGMGQLVVESVDIVQRLDDEGLEPSNQPEITDYTMTFTNKYQVDTATTNIDGVKNYNDYSGGNSINADKFSFQLKPLGGYVTAVGSAGGYTIDASEVPTSNNTKGQTVTTTNTGYGYGFGTISYQSTDVDKTYVYEVSEITGKEIGMQYDKQKYVVEVEVSEVTDDQGTYVVATPSKQPNELTFTNKYDPDNAKLTGNNMIHGTKTLTGRELKPNEEFYFLLTAKNDNAKTVLENPKSITVNSLENGSADFNFGELEFSKVGNYIFEVNEVANIDGAETTNGNGLIYDSNICTVEVTVTDNHNGSLEAEVTYSNDKHSNTKDKAEFINSYKANMNYGAQGTGGINVTKTLENLEMDENAFQFTITDSNPDDDVTLTDNDKQFGNDSAAANKQASMPKLQSLTFDQDDAGKTYTFIVDEVEPEEADKISGVTYDQSKYQVDIQVFDNGDGTMHTETTVTQIVDSNGNKVENPTPIIDKADSDSESYQIPTFGFVNTYKAAEVSLGDQAIKVKKTLDGRNWTNDDKFEFTLTPANDITSNAIETNDVVMEQPDKVTITKDTEDYITTFGDITFKKDGTYLFNVNEIIPEGEDYGTDVTMPENTEVTITNTTEDFTASFGDITFSKEGTYTFNINEVIPQDAVDNDNVLNGITYDSTPSTVSVTVSDNDQGQLIIEKVVYDNDENLTAAEFTNTYSATGTTSIEVTKDLKGRKNDEWIDGDTFTFTLTSAKDYGADVVMPQSTTLTIEKDTVDHKASFGDITFNKAGDYAFKVTEVNDSKTNVTYSTEVYTVSVHVEDVDGNGTFAVTSTITNSAEEEVESIVFENTYTPNSVTLTGEDAIHGTKTLTGRDSKENETFSFTLTEDEKNDKEGYTIAENGDVASVGSLTDGQAYGFNFGGITFTKHGTYTFYVSEVLPEGANESNGYTLEGVTYDNHRETVTVTVTDDYMNNTLVPTVTYDPDGVTFINKYDASDFVGIPTHFTLTKVFEGKTWTAEDVFEFTLTAGENTAGIETPMPDNPTVQVNAPTEKDGKTANFDFGSISYDTVGEYHYTVSETEGTNAGIKYSKNVAEITVTVTDNKQGGLVASATVIKGTFTNTYSSELDYVGKGGIKLIKNLTGHDLADDQFTFTLNAEDEASRVKAGMENMSQDVFNTADTMDENGLSTSTIQLLPKMQKFTQDDVGKVYIYTISETSKQQPGYTNDKTKYTIEISTTDDGKGTLIVSTRITGTNGTDITYEYTQSKQKAETGVAQVVFNNTYTSSTNTEGYDASVNLTGTKTLTNRPMVDGEFQFNVLSNGSVVLSGTNTADGIVTFTPINYTNDQLIKDHANGIASKEGNTYTYVYDVEEVTPGNGVSIVAGKFSVTVKVTDNGDGKLVTNVIYPETGLAFENAYGQSANAELNIHGTKKLAENGTNHPDITGKFQFTITGSDGAPMPEQTTVTNDASGNINFGKIVYTMQNVFGDDGQQTILEEEPVVDQEMPIAEEQTTEDGTVSEDVVGLTEQVETYSEKREKTFTYTITESGSLPGVTNDSAKVINVKVIDNGNGTISVTSDTQGTFTFVNTYVPDPTDETSPTDSAVTIKKVLDGRTLKADEFSFTMMDENGNGVQATNAEDGSVVFPKLTFDKEGIYTYTISETNDNKGGVTYDTTTYKAIATVTDDTSGKLKVEWKVTDAQGKEINEITFNNKYTVQPTSLTLGATKVLEGRELADKEFLFVLSDEEGNVVEEAYNDKTGKVTFSDLTFDKAGTYNYTVTEKNTNAKGITYDESVYNIQVEVVDNEDGTLNMTTTTTKDGEVSSIVFKNKAEKDSVPEQPEKGDTSNTSTQTYAGLFTSLAVNAAALAGIATLLKKRNEKQ